MFSHPVPNRTFISTEPLSLKRQCFEGTDSWIMDHMMMWYPHPTVVNRMCMYLYMYIYIYIHIHILYLYIDTSRYKHIYLYSDTWYFITLHCSESRVFFGYVDLISRGSGSAFEPIQVTLRLFVLEKMDQKGNCLLQTKVQGVIMWVFF